MADLRAPVLAALLILATALLPPGAGCSPYASRESYREGVYGTLGVKRDRTPTGPPPLPHRLQADRSEDDRPPVLSIEEAYLLAAARSELLDLRAEEIVRLDVAEERAWGDLFPSASLSARYVAYDPERIFLPSDNAVVELRLRQPLFDAPAFLEVTTIRARRRSELASIRHDEQAVLFEAGTDFLAVIRATAQVEVLESSLEFAEAFLEDVRARHEVGEAIESDLLSAEAEVARVRGDLAAARHDLEARKETLAARLEIAPDFIPAVPPSIPALERSLVELQSAALEERADLDALSHLRDAAEDGVRTAYAGFLPGVFAELRGDHQNRSSGFADNQSWDVTLGLRWEIFSGFSTVAALREARSRLDTIQLEQRRAAKQVATEVAQAYHDVRATAEQLASARSGVEAQARARELFRAQYEVGEATALDLLQATRSLEEARLRRAQAEMDLERARLRLRFVTGDMFRDDDG